MTFDDALTLGACVKRLMYQNIIPNIIIHDSGSYDGTPEMITKQIENKFYKEAYIRLLQEDMNDVGKIERKAKTYEKLAKIVDTKYIFFLSAKLLLPPFCIVPLIEKMKKDPLLGMLGIRNDIFIDNHICIDPAIMRTEDAQKTTFNGEKCVCGNVLPYFKGKGQKVEYDNRFIASNLKTLL